MEEDAGGDGGCCYCVEVVVWVSSFLKVVSWSSDASRFLA